MATAPMTEDGRPLAELNTTPLIDVLLVLLILFVITIPPASHVVDVDLPAPDHGSKAIQRDHNLLVVTADGRSLWNGQPVTHAELAGLLGRVTRMSPEPETRFVPDAAAPYGATAEVLRTIRAAGVAGFGFVGTERYGNFGKQPGK
ncbi:MAG: ExbD/TolR family protein [Novosphingobium sp.]